MTTSAASTTTSAWDRALAYVPRTLVDVLAHGGVDADGWIQPLDGTLVVADVSGFTPLSERLARTGPEGAERLTSIMNGYFERLLEIAARLGGDNLKFGGDALLLAFRGPGHADRAVAAALRMQRSTTEFPAIRVGGAHQRLAMSIGAHTARFWFAAAGTPQRMQHLLVGGDAARLAATEGAADRGEVAVTPETVAALTDATVEDLGDRLVVRRSVEPPEQRVVPPFMTDALGTSLLPFLPPMVAEDVRTGAIDLRPAGDHRRVAVLFVGVRGVNELADRAGPEDAFAELQAYVRTVLGLLERHHGYLAGNDIDARGTKLICLFGAPVAAEDDAGAALRFTVDLLDTWADRNSPLTHHIGCNVGSVFAGDAGSSHRRDYTIIGDDVNLAARLMGVAEPGTAVASAWTESRARGRVLTPVAPVRVKGKAEPVPIGVLRPGATWVDSAPSDSATRVVGREEERGRLADALDAALAGRGSGAHVVGEPGTGKTVLVEAVLGTRLDWRVLEGRCQPYTTAQPYSCWAPVVRSLLGIGTAGSRVALPALRDAVAARLPDRVDEAGLLADLLGPDGPVDPRWDGVDGETRRSLTFTLVTDLVAASDSPTVVVLEDAQWIDTSSAALLAHVAAASRGAPVGMVVTARPPADRQVLPDAVRIRLGPLPKEAVGELLDDLAGLRGATMLDAVWSKTGGNPLFVVELAQLLAERLAGNGVVDPDQLPDRVQGLLMGRLDRLPPTARHVLACASVLGSEFEHTELAELAGVDEVGTALQELRRARLVRPAAEGRHVFLQNLLQDVAYGSLAFSRRRELHRRAAAAIERRFATDLEPHLADLARHHRHGGDPRRTIPYAVAAGDRARRLHANDEALTSYRHALAAVASLPDRNVGRLRSLVRERIADSLDVLGHHAQAAELYETALRGWRASRGDPPQDLSTLLDGVDPTAHAAVLCRKIAWAHARTETAFATASRWLAAAERALPTHGHVALRGTLAIARATLLFRQGQYEASLSHARRGLELSRDAGPSQRAEAHEALARPLVELGQLAEAVANRRESLALYEELGELVGLMVTHNNVGSAEQVLGNLDLAQRHYEQSREVAARLRRAPAVAIVENNLGEVLVLQDRPADAIPHLEACVAAFDGVGAVAGLALVNLARARRALGQLTEARDALERGQQQLEDVGASGLLVETRVEEALLLEVTGDRGGAVAVADRARTEAEGLGMQPIVARATEVLERLGSSSTAPS